ncbi:hypothetical protein QP835_11000 [Pseudomonas oryzihabitans]|uniref:hypothetical protein n=1 Tax=Pseudomonas oryzihabitans TaxID=47885 RepID=UPI002554A2AD|nr:hypothetical protein [Pseudomonas oryzihabitans]MDK8264803.1 hypothetical protein [Pseudomonas oryzihabitans]
MTGFGARLLKGLLLAVIAGLPPAYAAAAETSDELPLIDRLEAVAIPIGRGAVLQDARGCLWSVRPGPKVPQLVAVSDEAGHALCRTATTGVEPAPEMRRTPLVN